MEKNLKKEKATKIRKEEITMNKNNKQKVKMSKKQAPKVTKNLKREEGKNSVFSAHLNFFTFFKGCFKISTLLIFSFRMARALNFACINILTISYFLQTIPFGCESNFCNSFKMFSHPLTRS